MFIDSILRDFQINPINASVCLNDLSFGLAARSVVFSGLCLSGLGRLWRFSEGVSAVCDSGTRCKFVWSSFLITALGYSLNYLNYTVVQNSNSCKYVVSVMQDD